MNIEQCICYRMLSRSRWKILQSGFLPASLRVMRAKQSTQLKSPKKTSFIMLMRKINGYMNIQPLLKQFKAVQLKGVPPYLVKLWTLLHDPMLLLSRCIWGKTAHSERTIRLAFSSRDDMKKRAFKSLPSLSSTWYFIIEHFLSSLRMSASCLSSSFP